MGAFAGFGLGALAGSEFLQGQQAAGVARQQMQMRQVQQQIELMKALQQAQQLQAYQKALSGASPQEQQFLNLGGTPGEWVTAQNKPPSTWSLFQQNPQALAAYEKAIHPGQPQKEDDLRWTVHALQAAHPGMSDLDAIARAKNMGPQPLEVIAGPGGVPTLVPRSQAINKPAASRPGAATKPSEADLMLAKQLGLPTDWSKWSPDDITAIAALRTVNAKAKADATRASKLTFKTVGNEIMAFGVGPDGNPTMTKVMDIPATVKNRNEYTDYVTDWLNKHPGASPGDAVRAYEDFKSKEATARSVSTATALSTVPGREKILTPNDRAHLVSSALSNAAKILQSWMPGIKPSGASIKKYAETTLFHQGFDLNGQDLPDGATMIDASGNRLHWRK